MTSLLITELFNESEHKSKLWDREESLQLLQQQSDNCIVVFTGKKQPLQERKVALALKSEQSVLSKKWYLRNSLRGVKAPKMTLEHSGERPMVNTVIYVICCIYQPMQKQDKEHVEATVTIILIPDKSQWLYCQLQNTGFDGPTSLNLSALQRHGNESLETPYGSNLQVPKCGTALQIAACKCFSEIIWDLLDSISASTDYNLSDVPNNVGNTALHYPAKYRRACRKPRTSMLDSVTASVRSRLLMSNLDGKAGLMAENYNNYESEAERFQLLQKRQQLMNIDIRSKYVLHDCYAAALSKMVAAHECPPAFDGNK